MGLAWKAGTTSLNQLLQSRIERLFSRLWLHLGTAVGLLGVILSLVYFVARQIANPIRSLAKVAEHVSLSGDYSVRAAHDSSDEIGQLVVAFNRMLGELDRDRAIREELTASARAEQAQRALVEAFPAPLFVTSIPDHRVLHANEPAAHWLSGIATDPWSSKRDPAVRAQLFQRLNDVGAVDGFEVLWQSKGSVPGPQRDAWALLSARRLTFHGQHAMLTTITPIAQIKLLEQRLQLWAKIFESSSESIVVLDVERRVLTTNHAFCRSTGWDVEEVAGKTPDFLYSDHHDHAFYETLWQSVIIRSYWHGEVWLRRKNGDVFPNWIVANAICGHAGRITNRVAAAVDISEHKARDERIHHLAHHDVLTDLPNRALRLERLRMAIARAAHWPLCGRGVHRSGSL